jgi:hypothetical protein
LATSEALIDKPAAIADHSSAMASRSSSFSPIVILPRQQLFTENTVTAVLPIMHKPSAGNIALLLRLWGVVLNRQHGGDGIFRKQLLAGENDNNKAEGVSQILQQITAGQGAKVNMKNPLGYQRYA